MDKKYINWKYFIDSCLLLGDRLKDENITDIVGISRGGLIPGAILGYKLGVQRVYSHGMYTYDIIETKKKEKNVYQPINIDLKDHKVLIIDEICDTGETFKDIIDHLTNKCGSPNIVTCSVFYKPNNIYKPNYFIEEVPSDIWVVMPYDHE